MQNTLKALVIGNSMKTYLAKLLPYSILLISISSVLQWCTLPIGNTFLWWLLQSIILYTFYKMSPKQYSIPTIRIFLIYLFISAIYGAIFMTENYWDWKLLIRNLMIFMLPLACYCYVDPETLKSTIKIWLNYAWIIVLCLTPFLESDAFGRILVPMSFLSLFLPFVKKRYVLFIIISYLITLILGSDSRSDALKFSITILIGLACGLLWEKRFFEKFINTLSRLFLFAPFVFFTLGITGTFNIFQIERELGLEGRYTMNMSSGDQISVFSDTRTFLYVEEITSAISHDYVIWGRSIARGYESAVFGQSSDVPEYRQRNERGDCETSILNIFNYFGVIGVIIYFVVFAAAVNSAQKKSNNIYVKAIGLYVAFRWMFAWVEDFSRFDLNYLFLWIMIGMCHSPLFLNLSNEDVKKWVRSL